ncbi:MAG: GAF domain-containing protein, partial [Burkholderiaceae bacterium]
MLVHFCRSRGAPRGRARRRLFASGGERSIALQCAQFALRRTPFLLAEKDVCLTASQTAVTHTRPSPPAAFDSTRSRRRARNCWRVSAWRATKPKTLNKGAPALAAEPDLQTLVQQVTDASTELTGAKFGAFFYNVISENGEAYTLYTLSGAPREAFEKLGLPRNTPIFEPTFRGTGVVRIDDVLRDPRYGTMAPHHGMPKGHLPVRSYLAAPVTSHSGEVLGGLFFGHPEVGVFTERHERLVVGLAAQAAIAMDNARLYGQAQQEIAQRKRAEKQIAGQQRTLEALAVGRDLSQILALTTRNIEQLFPGARASVLLADADATHLFCGSAQSLPDDYSAAIEGIAIGEGISSCGTAAFRRTPVIVSDIARDPLWRDFRQLAATYQLAACWSHPILAPDGRLLGTFAIYFDKP